MGEFSNMELDLWHKSLEETDRADGLFGSVNGILIAG